jgi:hypothetical protein
VGLLLAEGELGIAVDPVRQLLEIVARRSTVSATRCFATSTLVVLMTVS